MKDSKLRSERLEFYTEDMDRLHAELDSFLELSKARCALLIDRDGHLVTRRGDAVQSSADAISALVAGSFAATKEMARLLGETEFSVMFHQGKRDSIQLQLVGERTLLAVLFDDRTNLGLVRFYAQEAALRMQDVFEIIVGRRGGGELASNFSDVGEAALDELF